VNNDHNRRALAMAMVAYFGMSLRRGATVTAFSFASFSTRSAAVAAAGEGKIFSNMFGSRRTFHRTCASGVELKTATATELEKTLEKTLEVTHPAYDVINKDVVYEYGAYCTLFRHKKSGAELLSVSSDDDNKVCTFWIILFVVFGWIILFVVFGSFSGAYISAGKSFRSLVLHSARRLTTPLEFLTFWSILSFAGVASIQQRILLFNFYKEVCRHF
jgi:hypothetical protein